jgi:DNA-binding CsgD family transcriptional regulator
VTEGVAAAWPLIGRDGELAAIARARGDRPGVVVSAPAGVGKSRLAREALEAAAGDGAMTHWAQATSSAASVPLGAFAGLIPDDVRSDDPLELMRRSAEALRGVVLGVDDAQLLDPVSAALVLHLTETGTAFTVATVRSGEPCPDAIVSLWKDAGSQRLELEPLGDDAVSALVEAALGGPLDQAALHWVIESSRGNALYVRELVLGALDAGTLALDRGLWRLSGRPPLSATLAELVARRLGGLGMSERSPVELLALGEPLRLVELTALAGEEPVMAAEATGLVVADTSEVRLAHPLYGEVVRRDMPVLRARLLRLQLAETLQARDPVTPGDALRVARLRLDAGAPVPPDLLLDAARAATVAADAELGARLAQLALDGGGGLPATLVLARALAVRGRYDDAEAALAAGEAGAPGDPVAMDYLEQRTWLLYWNLGRGEDARALLDGARSWSPEPSWRRALDPLRVSLAGFLDGFAGAAEITRETLADPELDQANRRRSEAVLAISLFFSGRTRQGYELARTFRPPVPLEDQNDMLFLGTHCLTGIESGEDWAAVDAYMSQVLRDAVRGGDDEAAGIGAFTLAHLRFLEGRFRDAERWLAEAEVHFERQDTVGSMLHTRVLQLGIAYFTGDLPRAIAMLDDVRAVTTDPLPTQIAYVERAEGWAARAQSDAAGAERLLRAADELAPQMPAYATQLAYEALRAGAAAGDVAGRIDALAPLCDGRLIVAYGSHAAAHAARDGRALLQAAGDMAAIGALHYAGEAATQAAEAFLRDGREDSARRAAARARELQVPGQGAAFPGIDGLDAAATGLTRREAQVAALAARGLTNAEIAEQLVLSVRTVETHVYRAMQKLGVSDRHEL